MPHGFAACGVFAGTLKTKKAAGDMWHPEIGPHYFYFILVSSQFSLSNLDITGLPILQLNLTIPIDICASHPIILFEHLY